MFYVLHLTVWSLVIVSGNNLQWSRVKVFSYPPLLIIKVEKNPDRKARILTPRRSVSNVFFGILKNT